MYLCENAGIPVDLGKDDQMRRRERDPGIGRSDAQQRHLATLHRLKSKQYDIIKEGRKEVVNGLRYIDLMIKGQLI